MFDYLDLIKKKLDIHLVKYENIVIYADFRFLIHFPAIAQKKEEFLSSIYRILMETGKTFFAPSYTYTTEGRFDVDKTPTNVSAISKWLIKHHESVRSEHPLFSYIAFGPNAFLLKNVAKSAFGEGSVYDRLRNKNTGFLHFGRPVGLGNTMLHHVEHMAGATYRIHKCFKTKVFENDIYVGTDYSAFVRRRDVKNESFSFNFKTCEKHLKKEKIILETNAQEDTLYLASYSLDEARQIMFSLFENNQTSFISSKFKQY